MNEICKHMDCPVCGAPRNSECLTLHKEKMGEVVHAARKRAYQRKLQRLGSLRQEMRKS